MPVKSIEKKELTKIEGDIKEAFNQRLNIKNLRSIKPFYLICAQMLGVKISQVFDIDYNYVISMCPKLAQFSINNFTQAKELMSR